MDDFHKNKLDIARRTIRKYVHENLFNLTIEDKEDDYKIVPNQERADELNFAKVMVKALSLIDTKIYPEYNKDINKNALLSAAMTEESNKECDLDKAFILDIFGAFNEEDFLEIDPNNKFMAYKKYLLDKHGNDALYIDAIIHGEKLLRKFSTTNKKEITKVRESYDILVDAFGPHKAPQFPKNDF